MNFRLIASAALIAAFSLPSVAAETSVPTSVDPVAADKNIEAQLKPLVARIGDKMRSGAKGEAAFADELKAFDALLRENEGKKTEAVAQVAVLRAMVYVQILDDYEKGGSLLEQVKAGYPGTEASRLAATILNQLEAQKESLKIQASLKPGAAFPDFDEKDTTGAPLSVAQFKGKVVLVDFWATWCGPCVAELPSVLAAYQKYHDKGFEIIGISLDKSQEKLKAFVDENKMTWPQYFDGQGWSSKLGQKYGVNSIPATYLLDRDGRIVAKNLRGADLEAELAKLLGQ